jgi:hypothetical protein
MMAAALLHASVTLLAETPPPPLPQPLPASAEPLAWVLPWVLSAGLVRDPRLANCVWPYTRDALTGLTAPALCERDGAADELTFEVYNAHSPRDEKRKHTHPESIHGFLMDAN